MAFKGTRRDSTIMELEKFGKLTPIKNLNKKDNRKRYLWLFKCDCGNEVEVSGSDVKLGRKIDCGCGAEQRKLDRLANLAKSNTIPEKGSALNRIYRNYKRAAISRDYIFELTKEEFKHIISKKCVYCNSEPSNTGYGTEKRNEETLYLYNGIDRKDNSIGYTSENCVPCCYVCNKMKMNLDYTAFINQIKLIFTNMKEV
jgi:hypothetical protein